ncbi:hypothetical protein B0I21_11544 [Sphingobacterium paludis]|uniref:Uncharacterized protein n=1 Tax=Sphingobacterium paludis TaxID=1476465 RepID=A0A4R7CS36_9SPHI|nr:hypothetical protein B0I21_11544 [Sphingobacterium paludis]
MNRCNFNFFNAIVIILFTSVIYCTKLERSFNEELMDSNRP